MKITYTRSATLTVRARSAAHWGTDSLGTSVAAKPCMGFGNVAPTVADQESPPRERPV